VLLPYLIRDSPSELTGNEQKATVYVHIHSKNPERGDRALRFAAIGRPRSGMIWSFMDESNMHCNPTELLLLTAPGPVVGYLLELGLSNLTNTRLDPTTR
jgi:hypothetical protein